MSSKRLSKKQQSEYIEDEDMDEEAEQKQSSKKKVVQQPQQQQEEEDAALDDANDDENTDEDAEIMVGEIRHASSLLEQHGKSMEDDDEDDDRERPQFKALSAKELADGKDEYTRVHVPPNRYTPLKNVWMDIYKPIVEHMGVNIRFNPKKRCIELKTAESSVPGALQKCTDFIKAFLLGFEVRDAIALLRLDDLYLDSFEVKDVKNLHGEHLSRAIGRIAGQGGKTKYTIENATKTRIVLADTHVHLLGSFQNIGIAKDAVVRLILGSPPGKVYTQMRNVAARQKNRF